MQDQMNDPHRVITLRLRLNQAESQALAKLTTASGINAAALLRSLIRDAAANLDGATVEQ